MIKKKDSIILGENNHYEFSDSDLNSVFKKETLIILT